MQNVVNLFRSTLQQGPQKEKEKEIVLEIKKKTLGKEKNKGIMRWVNRVVKEEGCL